MKPSSRVGYVVIGRPPGLIFYKRVAPVSGKLCMVQRRRRCDTMVREQPFMSREAADQAVQLAELMGWSEIQLIEQRPMPRPYWDLT